MAGTIRHISVNVLCTPAAVQGCAPESLAGDGGALFVSGDANATMADVPEQGLGPA